MVVKTENCQYSEYRVYPGRGQRYIAKDGRSHLFITGKVVSLFQQKIKPAKLRWTQNWRRMNKKGKAEEVGRRRTKKTQKVQKAITGMTLEDIRRKRAQRPEVLRLAAKEKVLQEHKDRAKRGQEQQKKVVVKHASASKPMPKQQKQKAAATGGKRF